MPFVCQLSVEFLLRFIGANAQRELVLHSGSQKAVSFILHEHSHSITSEESNWGIETMEYGHAQLTTQL